MTASTQTAGVPFAVSITARDQYGGVNTPFNTFVTLSVNKGSVTPTTTTNFIGGVLTDCQVTIPGANTNVVLTAAAWGKSGSKTFTVLPS